MSRTDDTELVARLRALGTAESSDLANLLQRASSPEGAESLYQDVLEDARAHGQDPFEIYPRTAEELISILRATAREVVEKERR